jgi:hypothetical protein
MPKSDYILSHLENKEQINAWLKMYKEMNFKSNLGSILGAAAFLFVCKDAQDDLTGLSLESSVPSGFDFTYCQEWGLTLNAAVLARTILDIRKKAYGSIESQLDLLYHDMTADKGDKTGEWYKAMKAVKTANPK